MGTFVLVHGAWHGGWCWKRLRPLLRKAGHEVYAPSLMGLGDRGHGLNRSVNLATHIEDVVSLLAFEDLRDVTLVGHQYGGMVISGVAERTDTRISQLVYLDAFVPLDGEAVIPIEDDPRAPFVMAGRDVKAEARERGDGWLIPPPSRGEDGSLFGVRESGLVTWMEERLTPHPLATLEQPLSLKSPAAAELPRAYIRCMTRDDEMLPHAERAAALGWDMFELATGTDAMFTDPVNLTQILLGLG